MYSLFMFNLFQGNIFRKQEKQLIILIFTAFLDDSYEDRINFLI